MKKTFKKISAVFLAMAMSITPCLTGMGTVFAADKKEDDTKYHVTILDSEHGALQFKGAEEKTKDFQAGETVELDVLPEKGYALSSISVQAVGSEESVEDTTGGKTYTFTMPSSDLTISSIFSLKETKVKGELLGDDEVYQIKEDTDYSKISRKEYEEIDWSKYGGNGIYEPNTKEFLESLGIDVGKDANYGSKLAEFYEYQPSTFIAVDPTWQVGTKLTGNCRITNAFMNGSQSYFELSDFTGELAGAEMNGLGWCANHTAAEPQPGHPIISAVATITSINKEEGYVYLNLLVTPEGVTDGVSTSNGMLTGYQRIGANIKLKRDFNGKAHLTKSSANTVCTTGNTCYSLEGAEYGVYTEASCSNKVASFKTDANGSSNTIEVPVGNYWVKELKAPKGYYMDTKVYPITVKSNETAEVKVSDVPMDDPAAIRINKIDKDTGKPVTQGASSLAGAQFTFKHYGGHYTLDEIKAGKPAQDGVNVRTWVIETKEEIKPNGDKVYVAMLHPDYVVSGSDEFYLINGLPSLPLGTLTVQETKAPNGYLLDGATLEVEGGNGQFVDGIYVTQIQSDKDGAFLEGGNIFKVSDKIAKGGVKTQKFDKETNTTTPQGDGTLSGAKFDIISANNNPVVVEGKTYQKGQVVKTITTDANGHVTTSSDLLPFGNYLLKEQKSPEGYLNTGIIERAFTITENGTIVDMTASENAIHNDIIRGGVKIQKRDMQSGDAKPQGSAKLGPIEVDIINSSKSGVMVEGKMYQPGEVVKHLVTNKDGYVETAKNLLPYGTYTIKETKAPEGYLADGVTTRTFTIRENGVLVDMTDKDHGLLNRVIRGDFELVKADEETQERMANIPFKLTSNTTGESHTFMTDENGYYSSETVFNKHSKDTNGGKASSGLWFGLTANGKNVPVDDTMGALPFDTYTLEELKCKENADKVLYRGTMKITREGYTVNLGTIDNPDLTLRTKAVDEETQTQIACADDEVTIIDELRYTGLKKGKSYVATGTLMDKETGKAILNEEGNPVTATRTFQPATAEGETEVEFTFDATGMDGKAVVVFETVTLNGKVIVEHKDLNDVDQTIRFPEIKTKALDKETETNVTKADKEITIVDTVTYKNLHPGKKYKVEGTLMDKATGKPVLDAKGHEITAKETFKAKESDGTVDVTFTFDGNNLAGQTVVVFEELYRGGELYAAHADIEDEAQTIYLPKVTTEAVDTESDSKNAMADGRILIKDTVSYENLIPGREYKVKGELMDKETGKPVVARKVNAEDPVFEIPENAVAISLTSGTYVYVGTGTEAVKAGLYKETAEGYVLETGERATAVELPKELITWTQEFANDVEGYLLDGKLTIKPSMIYEYSEKEEPVVGEATFVATEKDGKAEVVFSFDGKKYAGHTFVVFEELYMDEKSVAEHQDMDDEHQTIYVPEIHTTALDKETGTHNSLADKEVVIVDTVTYKNLIPGKEYKVSGKLYDKETKKPLQVNDKDVVAETVFTPEKADGTVDVTFKFNVSKLQGKTLVVFEKITINGKEVAIHADIEDKDQSIYFPELKTTATDKDDNDKKAFADKKVTIVDEVAYKNLTPGETYKLVGTLMDKATGKVIIVNEKPVQAVKTFKAEKADGKVMVEFTFDGSKLSGKDVVVFEKLYDNKEKEIGNHEDLNDVGQTIKMVAPPKPPVTKTGDSPTMFILLGVGVILIGTGAFLFFKKKKK